MNPTRLNEYQDTVTCRIVQGRVASPNERRTVPTELLAQTIRQSLLGHSTKQIAALQSLHVSTIRRRLAKARQLSQLAALLPRPKQTTGRTPPSLHALDDILRARIAKEPLQSIATRHGVTVSTITRRLNRPAVRQALRAARRRAEDVRISTFQPVSKYLLTSNEKSPEKRTRENTISTAPNF